MIFGTWLLLCGLAADRLDLGGGCTIDLVTISAGEHDGITISHDFTIGRTPITRGQFARFVAASGYRTESETGRSGGFGLVDGALVQRPAFTWRSPGFAQTDEHPVVLVTAGDAAAFCVWAERTSARTVRLPSEAEWALAAAGKISTWSASAAGTRAVHGDDDWLGCVNQWCLDWYVDPPPRGRDPVAREPGPETPARQVLRGGSFLGPAQRTEAGARWRNTPGSRNADNGFRIVVGDHTRSASPPTASGLPPMLPAGHLPEPPRGDNLWVVIVGFLAFLGGIIYFLVRATRHATIRVELAADGFWLRKQHAQAGRTLSCQIRCGGRWRTEQIPLTDAQEGQFVFTGSQPEQVVLGKVGQTGTAKSRRNPALDDRSDPPHSWQHSSPSAY